MSQTDIVIQWFTDRANGTVVPDLIPAPIIDFLPTILLWSFTALLPLLVAYSDRWLGHYTRSEVSLNYVFFFLYFIFLLLEEKMEHFRGSSRLYYNYLFFQSISSTPDSGSLLPELSFKRMLVIVKLNEILSNFT